MAHRGSQSPPYSRHGDIRGSSYSIYGLTGKDVKVTQNKISMKRTSENTRNEKEEVRRHRSQSPNRNDSNQNVHTPQDDRSVSNQVDTCLETERTRFSSFHFKPIADLPGCSTSSNFRSTSFSESKYHREPSISSDFQHHLHNNQVKRFDIPSSSNEGNSAASDNTEDFDGDDEDETGQDNSSYCSSSTGSRNGTSTSTASVRYQKERKGAEKITARMNYCPSQTQILERAFDKDPYPDKNTMTNLAQELEIPQIKIKIWFQNKRARLKRGQNGDVQDRARLATSMLPFMSPMFHYPFMPGTMPAFNRRGIYTRKTNDQSPSHSTASTTDEDGLSDFQTQLTPFQSTPIHLQMPPFFFPYGMFPQYHFGNK